MQKSVILPGSIEIQDSVTRYARRIYTLSAGAAEFTDQALLAYCGYTPEFGGMVERDSREVRVHVYTD